MPLFIAWPGAPAGASDALTTNVDLSRPSPTCSASRCSSAPTAARCCRCCSGEQSSVREFALAGVWGREVHLIDAERKYARAPSGDNTPLSLWSNRWSTMPVSRMPELTLPTPDDRAVLDRMPGSRIPVIRQPFRAGDTLPFWAMGKFSGNCLYRVRDDPAEENNLAGSRAEKDAADALRAALVSIDAPADQLERLGLA